MSVTDSHAKTIAPSNGGDTPIADLKFDKSSKSFIDRLPIEILRSIFISCAADDFRNHNGLSIPAPPCWVNVSYVSRQWRDVALNCQVLWTYLFILSPCWTEELLARSKQAPLKIHVNLGLWRRYYEEYRFLERVLDHIDRIQELRLDLSGDDNRALSLLLMLRSPAPLLRYLGVSITGRPPNWSWLPFKEDTPFLSTLLLRNCPAPWYSLRWGDLTTLRLGGLPIQSQQSFSNFLATLNHMQNLQYLHIMHVAAGAIRFPPGTTLYSLQKANLPHLSQMYLISPLSLMIAFLSCITMPRTTQLRLRPDHIEEPYSSYPDNFTPFCSLLSEIYSMSQVSGSSIPPIHTLRIGYWERRITLTFSGSKRDHFPFIGLYHTTWDSSVPLQILLDLPDDELALRDDLDSIISRICFSMPLSNVQNLEFFNRLPDLITPVFWADILWHLPDLRYLKLNGGKFPLMALANAPDDFLENHDERVEEGQCRTLVPALEELDLFGLKLWLPSPARSDEENVTIPPAVQILLHALSHRKLQVQGRLKMGDCEILDHFGQARPIDLEASWGNGSWEIISYQDYMEGRSVALA